MVHQKWVFYMRVINDTLKFWFAAKSLSDGGGIDGQFVWTSPKYKPNAGFKATPGGGSGSMTLNLI
jgi:hypothetical protein